jgi:uncharacterized membrane protein YqiK
MDNPETSLVVASTRQLPVFSANAVLKNAKTEILSKSALIGRVKDLDSKTLAVRVQRVLKGISAEIEKTRKILKEPLLNAGRQLDNLCAAVSLELDREYGRITNLVTEFDNAERRRVAEEQRLQQEELARIEREKQAEIDRLAREQREREEAARKAQEEADRKVREARAEADRLAREATNKKEREAAEKAKAQSEAEAKLAAEQKKRQDAKLAAQAKLIQQQTAAIEEKAQDAAYVVAKPVEISKVAGQQQKHDWEIVSINDWQLAKARPDLVTKYTFDMRAIKDILRNGGTLPGVTAKEIFESGVRSAKTNIIEV